MASPAHHPGSFSIQRAFVVQFTNHTALNAESLEGRIKHIVSGNSTRFQSLAELLTFVIQVLEAGHTSRSDSPDYSQHYRHSP